MRALVALVIGALVLTACRTPERRVVSLYPSPTSNATQTPLVVLVTTTPVLTQTAILILVTPTVNNGYLCVSATEAVYLRPAPSLNGYPITVLKNGTSVLDLGGRSGAWIFVEIGDRRGWVNAKYLEACE